MLSLPSSATELPLVCSYTVVAFVCVFYVDGANVLCFSFYESNFSKCSLRSSDLLCLSVIDFVVMHSLWVGLASHRTQFGASCVHCRG